MLTLQFGANYLLAMVEHHIQGLLWTTDGHTGTDERGEDAAMVFFFKYFDRKEEVNS